MATQRIKLSSQDYVYTEEGRYSRTTLSDILEGNKWDASNESDMKKAVQAAIKYEKLKNDQFLALERAKAAKSLEIEKRRALELAKIKAKDDAQTKKLQEEIFNLQKEQENELKKLRKENIKEYIKYQKEAIEKSFKDEVSSSGVKGAMVSGIKLDLANLGQSLTNALKNVTKMISNGVDEAIRFNAQYQAKADARLQGTNIKWGTLTQTAARNLAVSPYVTQQTYLQNVNRAIESGIAYNIEQRSFLQSIKEDIADTFDAFDSNLSRIIRIQQADSTAARLGMEAELTTYLNKYYSDTSYLSDVFDSVTQSLLEASATMGYQQSTEFEYEVQKWLGSLYSMGVSSSAIQSIAQAIGYMGSGNISALSGSSAANLLAISASRSGGKTYDQLLADGLDKSSISDLMSGMLVYLSEIAASSKGNIVASAYGNVFGLNVSDLAAIRNISQSDLSRLQSQRLSYGGMTSELTRQMGLLSDRLSMQTMIENVKSNFAFNWGQGVANNPLLLTLYELADLSEGLTGGIPLPSILAAGFGAMLEGVTIEQLLKGGLIGGGALSSIGSVISSISSKGGLDLSNWGATENISSRGGFGRLFGTSGVSTGASSALFISSGSTSDIASSALANLDLSASQQLSASVSSDSHTADDIYNKLFPEGGQPEPIVVKIQDFSDNAVSKMQYLNPFSPVSTIDGSRAQDDRLRQLITKIVEDINDASGVNVKINDTVDVSITNNYVR